MRGLSAVWAAACSDSRQEKAVVLLGRLQSSVLAYAGKTEGTAKAMSELRKTASWEQFPEKVL